MTWSDAARAAALEARRHHTRLFHGTTTNAGKQIKPYPYVADGGRTVQRIFLSTSAKDARDYARARAEDRGGKPVVHMVRVGKQPGLKLLSSDGPGKHAWWLSAKPLKNAKQYSVSKKSMVRLDIKRYGKTK